MFYIVWPVIFSEHVFGIFFIYPLLIMHFTDGCDVLVPRFVAGFSSFYGASMFGDTVESTVLQFSASLATLHLMHESFTPGTNGK